MCLAVQPIQGPLGEDKEKAKEKVKEDRKKTEEHSLAMNKHKILHGGQKRTLLGGPKDRKAREACRKATMAFQKGEEKTKKEKARKELVSNPDLQPQKHPTKQDMAMPGNQTIGSHWTDDSWTSDAGWFCRKAILFSHSQMKNSGTTIELDPKGDKITCRAFGLYSSPAEYSTMGHVVLDLTKLTYQPTTKSSNRSVCPKRHAILACRTCFSNFLTLKYVIISARLVLSSTYGKRVAKQASCVSLAISYCCN